jgi:hypothetical protein
MACHTQEEIAEDVGLPQQTVADKITENGNIAKLGNPAQAAADHATDFKPPIYNTTRAT